MAMAMTMKLLLVLTLAMGVNCDANASHFRAFYFMQQWLGSYCNQKGTICCNPPTGKPSADFTVYGLWPYFSDGSFGYNCGAYSYDVAPLKPIQTSLQKAWPSLTCPQIGRKFWLHEWNKHGTCTKSILDEISYLNAAVNLKNRINLLQVLAKAGIRPNNQYYPLISIKSAIFQAFRFQPWVTCNHNALGRSQIWQVALCVDRTGTSLIDCPQIPQGRGSCDDNIVFPSF